MPAYVVEKVTLALNDERKSVRGSRVLLIGVAYKRDIDDLRESPALDVFRLLEELGASVEYHDPFVPAIREDGYVRTSIPLTTEVLARADAVVIVTDHRAIDYQLLADHAGLVVDSRNAMANTVRSNARVVSLCATRPAVLEAESPVLVAVAGNGERHWSV